MAKWRKLTSWGIIGTTAALIVWDVIVASTEEKGDTISEVLLSASKKRPVIALAAGILVGHLFWPQRGEN